MMKRFRRLRYRMAAAALIAASSFLFSVTASQGAESANDSLTAITAAYVRAVKPGDQVEGYRELFGSIFRRVQRAYATEVDLPQMTDAAMKALAPIKHESGDPAAVFKVAVNAALASLDPHSGYLDAREQSSQRESISGSFGGLGMEVDMQDGLVRIMSPIEDTPASRAGLRSGDLIVRFDDHPVLGMMLADAVSRMRGRPGTAVNLVIRRAGQDDFSVLLTRETIRTQAVRWRMDDDVLVLRLSRFTGSAGADVEKAITAATSSRTPRALILDMRGNPGGLLNQAVVAADLFLSQGEIVSIRGRTPGNQRSWKANAAEMLPGVPMVVMLDGNSASAAELVAAALQENGRAIVMGQRSYGKGSVQTVVPLGAEKGALRLTTALYYGPSGRSVQRVGVSPDIELVVAPGTQEVRMGRREADRQNALPGADAPAPPMASVVQTRCPRPREGTDLALSCALAYVKAGGVETFVAALPPAPGTAQQ